MITFENIIIRSEMRNWPGAGDRQTWDDEEYSLCVHSVDPSKLHAQLHWNDVTMSSLLIVELRKKKCYMKQYGKNRDEQQGLEWITCAKSCAIIDTVYMCFDPVGNNTHTRSSKLDKTCCNADFSCPVVFSIWISSPYQIAFYLIHNSTIVA